MKLVEVVVLVGSQCVSPLQHAPNHTVAFQVPCAVLIQRDETSGRIGIKPVTQAYNPNVVRALQRYGADAGAEVAANPPPDEEEAPRGSLTAVAPESDPSLAAQAIPPAETGEQLAEQPEEAEAAAVEPVDDASEPVAAAGEGTDEAASVEPEPEVEPPAKVKANGGKKKAKSKRSSGQCKGKATPKWYTNAEGRRKYRCVAGGNLPVY